MATYTLTQDRLVEQHGVLNTVLDTMELYRIKDTRVSQPLHLRLIGRGNIEIDSSDKSSPFLVLHGIANPLIVNELLLKHIEAARVRKGVREFD